MAWSDAARRAALEARRRKRAPRIQKVNRLYATMRHSDKRALYGAKGDDIADMYGLDRAQGRLFMKRLNQGGRANDPTNTSYNARKNAKNRRLALRTKQRMDQAYEYSIKHGYNAGKKRGGFFT